MKLKMLAATYLVAFGPLAAHAASVKTVSVIAASASATLGDHPAGALSISSIANGATNTGDAGYVGYAGVARPGGLAQAGLKTAYFPAPTPGSLPSAGDAGAAAGNQAFKINSSGNTNTFASGADTPWMLLTALGVMGSIARRRRLAKKLA